jgi:hypothetical protein
MFQMTSQPNSVCSPRTWAGFFVLTIASVIAWSVPAEVMAQPAKGSGKAKGAAGTKPGAKKGTKKDSKEKAAPKRVEDAAAGDDRNKLPDGFIVPPLAPDEVTTTEECKFDPFGDGEDRKRQETRALAQYRQILNNGEFANDAEKKLVSDILHWKLCTLTHRDKREKAYDIQQSIFREIDQSGGKGGGKKRDVRKFMLQTVVDKSPEIFQYHIVARVNCAVLLANLSDIMEVEGEGTKNPRVPCTRARGLLLKVLDGDPAVYGKQPDAVRVVALRGLIKLALLPELKPTDRNEIVAALSRTLESGPTENEWLQMRIADGLGQIGLIYNQERVAIVPQALAVAVADRRRTWMARAAAASALGRLPYSSDVDLSLVAFEIARLTKEMADDFQKNPGSASWAPKFFWIYLAFRPANEDDEKAGVGLITQVNSKGVLAAHKKTVVDAYSQILPIVEKVIKDPKGLDEPLGKLNEWLKSNPPKTDKIADGQNSIYSQSATDQSSSPTLPPVANGAR